MISICSGLRSQDLFTGSGGERIEVCTDRTMYISGEKVFFTAVIYNLKNDDQAEYSRVFYAELITPSGHKITARKYLLRNFSGQGCIKIPKETISGIYFLKFYTRFMRNIPAGEYEYVMVKIVNPSKTEVLSGKNDYNPANEIQPTLKSTGYILSINSGSGKTTFSPREEISLKIQRDTGNGLPAKLCVSVIPESTYEINVFPQKNSIDSVKNGIIFPETRGISLTGRVVEKESRNTVPSTRVNLSIIGDKDILTVRCDTTGRFFFALPDYTGKRDLFICTDDLPDIIPSILIDNDFCSRPVELPSFRFKLNDEEMKAAFRMAVNFNVFSRFRDVSMTTESNESANDPPFYGEPSEVLVLEKYIDLPSIEEYFNELPGIVKVRKFQGKKHFRFLYTTQTEMSIYDPLVLIDWVAVNDIEKILAMPPLEVDRIELVSSPYIKGSVTYGGIISFISKKNNFAGIDLPSSGTFINYGFLEDCSQTIPQGTFKENTPDSRNTVYWNPDVQIKDDGSAGISFIAPDTPGRYHILLREMKKTGEVSLSEEMFVVKDN